MNPLGVSHYRAVFTALKAANIQPMVTLWHWCVHSLRRLARTMPRTAHAGHVAASCGSTADCCICLWNTPTWLVGCFTHRVSNSQLESFMKCDPTRMSARQQTPLTLITVPLML